MLFSSVQLLNHVQLFATPWTAACQSVLSIINSWSLLKLMSTELVMPSNHLILCCPLLLPSVFPSIRVVSNESVLLIRWPKCWSFSFSISPSNEYSGLISFRIDWLDLFNIKDKKRVAYIYKNYSKEYTCSAGDPSLIPGWERSPGAEHSNSPQFLAWRIPWREEPGGLQSMGSKGVRHN